MYFCLCWRRHHFCQEKLHDENPWSYEEWWKERKDLVCAEQKSKMSWTISGVPSRKHVSFDNPGNQSRRELCKISKAPKPSKRYKDFLALKWDKKIVTIEPILDFDLETFLEWILSIKPKAVFIGYNSRPRAVELPEPEKKKTWQLIHSLEEKGIQVLKKEMRDRRVTKKAYRDLWLSTA